MVWKQFDLMPGETSTKYLCDTDYLASLQVAWQWDNWIVQPWYWSPYLFNTTYRCKDHTVNGTASFKCTFVKYNWGGP